MGRHWRWHRYVCVHSNIKFCPHSAPLTRTRTRSVFLWRPPPPGFNIEEMDNYFPISGFDRVYLIDLCEPCVQCCVADLLPGIWRAHGFWTPAGSSR